ncbi:MAG: histidine kinase [Bacteroidales bacterium]|nr:histidine kinase [Bacteroidales bacterium]
MIFTSFLLFYIHTRNKNRIFILLKGTLMMRKLHARNVLTGLIHGLAWIAVFLIPHYLSQRPGQETIEMRDIILWTAMVIFFYINYYILIPNLLTKKKFGLYTVAILVLLLIAFSSIRFITLKYDSQRELEIIHRRHGPEKAEFILHRIARNRGMGAVFFTFLVLAVSTSIKVTSDWYKMDKKRKEAENEKLSTELELLKSQINPHFFFNTLNNIYSLSIRKSERTSEAIVKLSQLMRYIIYDTDKDKVPLSKEIDYINNYIELEKLRLRDNVEVRFLVDGKVSEKLIEPLLLLPFIENAFKHGIGHKQPCTISIRISLFDSRLILCVENPVLPKSETQQPDKQGFGMYNAERRLQLLYDKNYTLETTIVDSVFRVELILNLNRDEMSDSG